MDKITQINEELRILQKEKKLKLKELEELESNIQSLEDSLKLEREREILGGNIGIHRDEIPFKYDIDLFQHLKVIFILNELGEATVKTIADYMHKKEPKVNYKTIYTTALHMVLKLHREHKLNKIGNYKSKYSLNITKEK